MSIPIIHCLYSVGIWNSLQTIPDPCSSGDPSSLFLPPETLANSPSASSSVGMQRRISARGQRFGRSLRVGVLIELSRSDSPSSRGCFEAASRGRLGRSLWEIVAGCCREVSLLGSAFEPRRFLRGFASKGVSCQKTASNVSFRLKPPSSCKTPMR